MAITSTATTHSAPVRRTAASSSRAPSALQVLRDSLSQEAAGAQPSSSLATPRHESALGTGIGFSERQVAALSAPLDRAKVRQREQGRTRLSYLEGWQVISEANRIFGFEAGRAPP